MIKDVHKERNRMTHHASSSSSFLFLKAFSLLILSTILLPDLQQRRDLSVSPRGRKQETKEDDKMMMMMVEGAYTITSLTITGSPIFRDPEQFMIDPYNESWIYVADGGNNRYRVININTLTAYHLAGSSSGYQDGVAAKFRFPTGVAMFDPTVLGPGTFPSRGIICVDHSNHRIRFIDIDSYSVTTIAGSSSGRVDGLGTAARFNRPRQANWGRVSSDYYEIYITDLNNGCLRRGKVFPNTPTFILLDIKTVAGVCKNNVGITDGLALDGGSRLRQPMGIALTKSGDTAFVSDYGQSSLVKIYPMDDASASIRTTVTLKKGGVLSGVRGMTIHPGIALTGSVILFLAAMGSNKFSMYNETDDTLTVMATLSNAENAFALPDGTVYVNSNNNGLWKICCVQPYDVKELMLKKATRTPSASFPVTTSETPTRSRLSISLSLTTTLLKTESATPGPTKSLPISSSESASFTKTRGTFSRTYGSLSPTVSEFPTVSQTLIATPTFSLSHPTPTHSISISVLSTPTSSLSFSHELTETKQVTETESLLPSSTETFSQNLTITVGTNSPTATITITPWKVVPNISVIAPSSLTISENILSKGSQKMEYQEIILWVNGTNWVCSAFTPITAASLLYSNSSEEGSFAKRKGIIFAPDRVSDWFICTLHYLHYRFYTDRNFEISVAENITVEETATTTWKSLLSHQDYTINLDFIKSKVAEQVQIINDRTPPATVISKEVVASAETTAEVSAIASMAGGNPTVAIQAKRSALIMQLAQCDDTTEDPMEFIYHPTGVNLDYETRRLRPYAGCVIMNIVVCVAAGIGHLILVALLWLFKNKRRQARGKLVPYSFKRAQALLHFPALEQILILALMQPIAMAGTTLLRQSTKVESTIVAFVGFASILGVHIFLMYLTIGKGFGAVLVPVGIVPDPDEEPEEPAEKNSKEEGEKKDDKQPEKISLFRRIFKGRKEWKNVVEAREYHQQKMLEEEQEGLGGKGNNEKEVPLFTTHPSTSSVLIDQDHPKNAEKMTKNRKKKQKREKFWWESDSDEDGWEQEMLLEENGEKFALTTPNSSGRTFHKKENCDDNYEVVISPKEEKKRQKKQKAKEDEDNEWKMRLLVRDDSPYFVERYFLWFDVYRDKRQWFGINELVLITISGVLEGWRPYTDEGCGVVVTIQCWALVFFCFLVLVFRPYAAKFEGYFTLGLSIVQASAALATWIFYLTKSPPAINVGMMLAMIGLFYALIKTVADLSVFAEDAVAFFKSQRKKWRQYKAEKRRKLIERSIALEAEREEKLLRWGYMKSTGGLINATSLSAYQKKWEKQRDYEEKIERMDDDVNRHPTSSLLVPAGKSSLPAAALSFRSMQSSASPSLRSPLLALGGKNTKTTKYFSEEEEKVEAEKKPSFAEKGKRLQDIIKEALHEPLLANVPMLSGDEEDDEIFGQKETKKKMGGNVMRKMEDGGLSSFRALSLHKDNSQQKALTKSSVSGEKGRKRAAALKKVITDPKELWRKRLRKFYDFFVPEKTDAAIEDILARYEHQPEGYSIMWAELQRKYQVVSRFHNKNPLLTSAATMASTSSRQGGPTTPTTLRNATNQRPVEPSTPFGDIPRVLSFASPSAIFSNASFGGGLLSEDGLLSFSGNASAKERQRTKERKSKHHEEKIAQFYLLPEFTTTTLVHGLLTLENGASAAASATSTAKFDATSPKKQEKLLIALKQMLYDQIWLALYEEETNIVQQLRDHESLRKKQKFLFSLEEEFSDGDDDDDSIMTLDNEELSEVIESRVQTVMEASQVEITSVAGNYIMFDVIVPDNMVDNIHQATTQQAQQQLQLMGEKGGAGNSDVALSPLLYSPTLSSPKGTTTTTTKTKVHRSISLVHALQSRIEREKYQTTSSFVAFNPLNQFLSNDVRKAFCKQLGATKEEADGLTVKKVAILSTDKGKYVHQQQSQLGGR